MPCTETTLLRVGLPSHSNSDVTQVTTLKVFLADALLTLSGRSRGNHRRLPWRSAHSIVRAFRREDIGRRRFRVPGVRISRFKACANGLIWDAIRDRYRAGDEIRIFGSSKGAWKALGGYFGVRLSRRGRIVLEKILIRS